MFVGEKGGKQFKIKLPVFKKKEMFTVACQICVSLSAENTVSKLK